MNTNEVLKLALEALEGIHPGNMTPMAEEYWNKAITALREALAEPQEKYQYGTPLLDAMRGKANEALDKKAENAGELGLDYEPAQQEPPAWWPAVENILKEYGLQAIDFVADFKAALAEQPAQGCDYCNHPLYVGIKCKNCGREQPAQQEPVACRHGDNGYACCEGGLCAAEEHNDKTDWQERGMVAEAALAKLLYEKGEPVAVVSGYYGGQCVILPLDPARIFNSNAPLYTSPPQRKPLTDEQMWSLWNSQGDDAMEQTAAITFARAIEAAHGIKENT